MKAQTATHAATRAERQALRLSRTIQNRPFQFERLADDPLLPKVLEHWSDAVARCRADGFFSFPILLRYCGIPYGIAGRIKAEMLQSGLLAFDSEKNHFAWRGFV